MSVRYEVVTRAGLWAIIRVLPSGDAAGYDAVADREQEQRHYQIHRGTAHATAVDCAFADSRHYASLEAAMQDAEQSGREVFV